jgi:hypothetical protein
LPATSLAILGGGLVSAGPAPKDDGWSRATNGLESRLTLVEKDKLYGTRWLVPYLELRNVRDLRSQLEVNCDRDHLKVELVNANGEPIQRLRMPRSGPVPDLGVIILPWDSSILIDLECRN